MQENIENTDEMGLILYSGIAFLTLWYLVYYLIDVNQPVDT